MRRAASASIAGTLNLLVPGTGHLFLGRARRYFIPLTALLLIVLGLSLTGSLSTLSGFGLLAILLIGLYVFGIVDAIVLGARSGRDTSRWYSRWFLLLGWFALVQVLGLYWSESRDWLGYGIYRVPGASMRPTLTPGDIILTSSHVPPNLELPPSTLVVFRHPRNGVPYVLRIREETSPGTFSLNNGLPFASSLDGIPRENIVGLVTALIWSPERKEFARALK